MQFRYGVLTQAEQRSAGAPEHFGEIQVQHVCARVPGHAVQQVLLGIGVPFGGRYVDRRRDVGRGPHDTDTGRQPVRVHRVEQSVHRVYELANVGIGERGGDVAATQGDGRQQGDEGIASGLDHRLAGLSARVTGPARRLSDAAMGRTRDLEDRRDARRQQHQPDAAIVGTAAVRILGLGRGQPTRRIVLQTNQTRDGFKSIHCKPIW